MAGLDLSRYRGAQSASINSGGGSFDRKTPDNDHDPTRNALDWTDPMGAIADAAGSVGEQIRQGLIRVLKDLGGIDLSSWDAFLASLDDGKGIDLPFVIDVLAGLQAFFAGIDFTAPDFDPAEALEAFASAVKPLLDLTAKLRGLIDISWLTNEHQNLVDESGYDDPSTVVADDDPNITHDATDGVPGSTPLGCMKITCNGALHERGGKLIEVGRGWVLDAESKVKWQSITASAGANAIRLELQPFHVVGTVATLAGARALVGAVASPSGSSGGTGGWGTTISGSYTVPLDGSVTHVALFPKVTAAASAGTAKFDNTTLVASQDIPQEFIKDLLADLEALLNWITTVVEAGLTALGIPLAGDLIDKINDLADEWAIAREQAAQGLSEVADLIHDLLTNPAAVLGTLPKNIVDGLESAFDDLIRIFQGNPIVGTDPISTAVKHWWDIFFNGGAKQVVTQDQVAVESGIVPTDANTTIPWIYLPPELTPAALGHPWVDLTKAGTQTINSNAITRLTAWNQAGGFPLTDTSSVFKVPFAGLFHISVKASWVSSPDERGRLYLYKNTDIYRRATEYTDAGDIYSMEIHEYVPLDTTDTFDFRVDWVTTGTTRDISSNPIDTYVRITYIGATHLTATPIPTPTVTFDAKGTADNGSGDASWSHTFGANAKTVVIPYSHETPDLPTITCGPYNVPVLSGPTYIGNYFGFNARYSLAAAILPDAVKGTTQTITVDFPSGNAAFSGNSLSFNNVSYLGAVKESSGGSSANMMVPSNAFSQVAGGFGGMDANFSTFNRTQDNIWNFIAGNTWAHVIGHAQGGLAFTASAGKWAGKFIELHP